MNPRIGELPNPFTNAKVVGENVSYEVYARQDAKRGEPSFSMSRGELCEFARCPHRWLMGYESDETRQTDWGELIDCLILAPNEFLARFAVTPETYTNKQGKEIKWRNDQRVKEVAEWMDANKDKKPIKNETATQATNAAKFLLADREIQILLNNAKTQVMVVGEYQDEETALTIPVRALLDIVPSVHGAYAKCLADLKTCTSAGLRAWQRTVFERQYHVQAAFHCDLYTAATAEDRTDWLHVLQESFAPWQLGKRLLSSEFVEMGRLAYISALQRYCRCLKDNFWPGYETGELVLNGWAVVNSDAWMVA